MVPRPHSTRHCRNTLEDALLSVGHRNKKSRRDTCNAASMPLFNALNCSNTSSSWHARRRNTTATGCKVSLVVIVKCSTPIPACPSSENCISIRRRNCHPQSRAGSGDVVRCRRDKVHREPDSIVPGYELNRLYLHGPENTPFLMIKASPHCLLIPICDFKR